MPTSSVTSTSTSVPLHRLLGIVTLTIKVKHFYKTLNFRQTKPKTKLQTLAHETLCGVWHSSCVDHIETDYRLEPAAREIAGLVEQI